MSYPETRTFWLEPTDTVAVGLRRFTYGGKDSAGRFTCESGSHSMLVYIGNAPAIYRDTDHGRVLDTQPPTPRHDERWPIACACGYVFSVADGAADQNAIGDEWQDWQELLYRRADTGELVTLRDHDPDKTAPAGRLLGAVAPPPTAPPGASWDAWWMPASWRGPDGIALMVRCPNGHDWHVDGEASNCTRKGDRAHKCWVRHGDARQCAVTVDKNGETCAAGGGSIQAGDYHGFMVAGVLSAG
jgi:hypothetical protein